MSKYILAAVLVAVAIISFVISVRSFQEKGFLINNAYLYASEEERKTMDKKALYRQSAIVFLLLGVSFLLNAVEAILQTDWISYIVYGLLFLTIIYAFVSGLPKGNRRK